MKSEARFLGVRFATPQVTLGSNRRGPAVRGHTTVILEWEVRVDAVPSSSWRVYYRFVTSEGIEEMGLANSDCCYGSPNDRTVRLFLPCPGKQYEYQVVLDSVEDGTTGAPWQALPSRDASAASLAMSRPAKIPVHAATPAGERRQVWPRANR